ncbi:MAG: hypothetical protein NWQ46_04990 [Spirosomaceae bacterium]|nr:hypothetical protein [Spirosomataceae bacterium]
MVRKLLFLLLFSCSLSLFAQEADTLLYNRVGFNTLVFKQSQKLSHNELVKLYSFDKKTLRKYKVGRIMLPVSPVFAIAGTALAVDGLVGVDRTAQIDGINYDYVERSLPKLLLGLALVVTGGSFMEGSNDFKATAAKRYNEHIKKMNASTKTTFSPKLGITKSGNVAFRLEF